MSFFPNSHYLDPPPCIFSRTSRIRRNDSEAIAIKINKAILRSPKNENILTGIKFEFCQWYKKIPKLDMPVEIRLPWKQRNVEPIFFPVAVLIKSQLVAVFI